ncbi:hypothetical protein IPP24_05045 [Candidatus Saccharibacteria bacterium]|nr:MAG: hypothetical protein IPP24_05045 [Candidatus Saccharibacteria bacterium]
MRLSRERSVIAWQTVTITVTQAVPGDVSTATGSSRPIWNPAPWMVTTKRSPLTTGDMVGLVGSANPAFRPSPTPRLLVNPAPAHPQRRGFANDAGPLF